MAELIRNKEDGGSYSDLFATYGIKLVKGSYDELLKYPPMKEYITNDSRLQNGVQYLAKPDYAKFNEKNLSIQIVLRAASSVTFYANLDSFLTLMSRGMFELKLTTLGKVFRLVYKDCNRLQTYKGNTATFELKLTEPNPADRSESNESQQAEGNT